MLIANSPTFSSSEVPEKGDKSARASAYVEMFEGISSLMFVQSRTKSLNGILRLGQGFCGEGLRGSPPWQQVFKFGALKNSIKESK
jgi:hypothetical protein